MAQTPSTIPTQPRTSVPCGWAPRVRVRRPVGLAFVLGTASMAGVALTAHLGGASLACSGPLLIGWGA
jgi:hypothetical protein